MKSKANENADRNETQSGLDALARNAGFDSYAAYLGSPEWRARRREVLQRDGWRCVRCQGKRHLQVHHRRYARQLGDEPLDWLETLCGRCHRQHHEHAALEQKAEVRRPRASRRAKRLQDRFKRREGDRRSKPKRPTASERRHAAAARALAETQGA